MALQTARITAAVSYLTADKRRAYSPRWLKIGGFTDLTIPDLIDLRRQLGKLRHVIPSPSIKLRPVRF